MKGFTKVLSWELFRGIKEGKITSLIFDEEIFQGIKRNELVEFVSTNQKIKMYFISSRIVSFKDITDEDAKKCGFINRDLLAYYLIEKYGINLFFVGDYPELFNNKLFYIININESPIEIDDQKTIVLNNTTWKYYDYNVEYDDKPWRFERYERV